jgi:hypothetical protein
MNDLLTWIRLHVTLPVGNMQTLTGKTRRTLIACAMLVALAVPVESVLLAAMRTPDTAGAARSWAGTLTTKELQDAALHIETYPYFYRRAIMTALEPDERAQVWRRYLTSYAASHPNMDMAARALLSRAALAMTPDVFDDNPPADRVAELAAVFEIGVTVLGRRAATDLFMRLGPDTTSYAALPVAERAANSVRDWITVHARSIDCECTTTIATSCDVSGAAGDACIDASGCEPIMSWPMCGVAWSAPCNGTCTTLSRISQ